MTTRHHALLLLSFILFACDKTPTEGAAPAPPPPSPEASSDAAAARAAPADVPEANPVAASEAAAADAPPPPITLEGTCDFAQRAGARVQIEGDAMTLRTAQGQEVELPFERRADGALSVQGVLVEALRLSSGGDFALVTREASGDEPFAWCARGEADGEPAGAPIEDLEGTWRSSQGELEIGPEGAFKLGALDGTLRTRAAHPQAAAFTLKTKGGASHSARVVMADPHEHLWFIDHPEPALQRLKAVRWTPVASAEPHLARMKRALSGMRCLSTSGDTLALGSSDWSKGESSGDAWSLVDATPHSASIALASQEGHHLWRLEFLSKGIAALTGVEGGVELCKASPAPEIAFKEPALLGRFQGLWSGSGATLAVESQRVRLEHPELGARTLKMNILSANTAAALVELIDMEVASRFRVLMLLADGGDAMRFFEISAREPTLPTLRLTHEADEAKVEAPTPPTDAEIAAAEARIAGSCKTLEGHQVTIGDGRFTIQTTDAGEVKGTYTLLRIGPAAIILTFDSNRQSGTKRGTLSELDDGSLRLDYTRIPALCHLSSPRGEPSEEDVKRRARLLRQLAGTWKQGKRGAVLQVQDDRLLLHNLGSEVAHATVDVTASDASTLVLELTGAGEATAGRAEVHMLEEDVVFFELAGQGSWGLTRASDEAEVPAPGADAPSP